MVPTKMLCLPSLVTTMWLALMAFQVVGLGPLPVLQTFRGKEPFSRRGGLPKERVIVPDIGIPLSAIFNEPGFYLIGRAFRYPWIVPK